MSKPLVGHHLLRVRIRHGIFNRLKEIAREESERTDEFVTVSDLVRQGCVNMINMHDQLAKLSHFPDVGEDDLVVNGRRAQEPFDLDDDADDDGGDESDDPFVIHTLRS